MYGYQKKKHVMKTTRLPVYVLVFALMLVSCGSADENQTIENETAVAESQSVSSTAVTTSAETALEIAEAYPGPTPVGILEPYPPPDSNTIEETYPSPTRKIDEEKRFTFDEPIVAGQQEVSGTGPASVPIKIGSVSFAGEELGRGTISDLLKRTRCSVSCLEMKRCDKSFWMRRAQTSL